MSTTHGRVQPLGEVPVEHLDRRHVATLGAAMLGLFIVTMDAQIVNVALADIGSSLGTGLTGLQWVVTSYTLTFSALILLGGTFSDRMGARRTYALGMMLFATSSVVCGMAPNIGTLSAARLAQGVGAALVAPTSLALIRENFDDFRLRAKAIGLWSVGGAVAVALGPVTGGLLTLASWRYIFWVNLPVAVLALWCVTGVGISTRKTVPIDLVGQLSAIVALGSVTYAVIDSGTRGWGDPVVLGLLGGASLSAAVFFLAQWRGRHPMVPLSLFRARSFTVALAAAFASMTAFYAVVFVQALYFQQERAQTPLLAGLLFLPMTGAVTLVSLLASPSLRRFGRRMLLLSGLAVEATGLITLAVLPSEPPVWIVSVSMLPVGLGGALTFAPIASLVLDHAPAELAGTASGLLATCRQLGGSLGVAVVGAVIALHAEFTRGLRDGFLLGAAVLVVSLVVSLLLPPDQPADRRRQTQ